MNYFFLLSSHILVALQLWKSDSPHNGTDIYLPFLFSLFVCPFQDLT